MRDATESAAAFGMLAHAREPQHARATATGPRPARRLVFLALRSAAAASLAGSHATTRLLPALVVQWRRQYGRCVCGAYQAHLSPSAQTRGRANTIVAAPASWQLRWLHSC